VYMREVKQYQKEFSKNIRVGKTGDAMVAIKKYGINFSNEDGATGLMLALHHAQHAMAAELLKLNAPIRHTNAKGLLAIDYMVDGYYKTAMLKHQQLATQQTLKQFWHLVKPPAISVEIFKQRLQISSHSMPFFLLIAMRNKQVTQPNKITIEWPKDMNRPNLVTGAFSMDEMEAIAQLMPDEVLPPYRKNRTYINSILAANEISHAGEPRCKMLFERVKRGWYILNPGIAYGHNNEV